VYTVADWRARCVLQHRIGSNVARDGCGSVGLGVYILFQYDEVWVPIIAPEVSH